MFNDIIPIEKWGLFPSGKRPIVISGPCAAENEEMVLEVASQLNKMGVTLFRAGIWKPRTHPQTFEGVGEMGFEWLQRVQKEFGMKVATEVASAKHIDIALKSGVDLLWIGARTTANPFLVQELAEALEGVDIPLLVKNPINPEAELWIGAMERFYLSGIRKLGAVHRGFSYYRKLRYRYFPYWQIPIDIKNKYPQIPMFCDPSHIAGDSKYIEELSRQAMDLGFEGLMIETHNNPTSALSDAAQQITPEELSTLLTNLELRSDSYPSAQTGELIEELRSKIDHIDGELIKLLASRMEVVEKIGALKQNTNMTILQSERWRMVLEHALKLAEEKGLDEMYVERIFWIIHNASIEKQMKP